MIVIIIIIIIVIFPVFNGCQVGIVIVIVIVLVLNTMVVFITRGIQSFQTCGGRH